MQLRKIVKKGAVAALALFAAVAIVSCSSPSGSESGDDGKKNEQQSDDKKNEQIEPGNTNAGEQKDDNATDKPAEQTQPGGQTQAGEQNQTGEQTQSGEQTQTGEQTKPAEQTKPEKMTVQLPALKTTGTLENPPDETNSNYTMTDTDNGEYIFAFMNTGTSTSNRTVSPVVYSGTWQYKKDNKIIYSGTFTGESIYCLKLTIKMAICPDDELRFVVEEKTFDLNINKNTGIFTAEIPVVSVPFSVTINLWSFTDEVPSLITEFMSSHPEVQFKLKTTIVSTNEGEYEPALVTALENNEVDIYTAEAAFVLKYTQGERSKYAAPYEDFGIDIDNKIKAADIAQYTVDIGSNSDGDVVGLEYQTTGSCFIYNRSVAKSVFGTDNPAEIQKAIGGASGSWDKFWDAAAKCADKGVAIVSGDGDIWRAYEATAEKGWIDGDKLYIDPKREEFLDVSKSLTDKGWSNQTKDWIEGWFDDFAGTGPKPVLGFFGPAWMVNYTVTKYCGGKTVGQGTYGDWAVCNSPVSFFWGGTWILGSASAAKDKAKKGIIKQILEWLTLDTTEDGLLYQWATGSLDGLGGITDSVASAVVMKKCNVTIPVLGGQNPYDYFVAADKAVNSKLITLWDEDINYWWREQVRAYAAGEKTRDKALADFKTTVSDKLGLTVD